MIRQYSKKIITTLVPVLGIFGVRIVSAQGTGLVPCDNVTVMCGFNQVIQLISNIINFMFLLLIPIMAVSFAYAGIMYILSAGNATLREKAKGRIANVFIGIAIILFAWLGVATILKALGVTGAYNLLDF